MMERTDIKFDDGERKRGQKKSEIKGGKMKTMMNLIILMIVQNVQMIKMNHLR